MNWTPQRKIRVGFWLLALVPLITGLLGTISLRSLFVNADGLAHTNHTIRQLDKVYVELSDVESAESEYIVTGREAAVQPYAQVTKRLRDDLAELDRLTRDNPDQLLWMQHLRTLFQQKVDESKRILELGRAAGRDAAEKLRQEFGQGSRTMDDVRRSIRRIRDFEQEQLDSRTDQQYFDRVYALGTFILVMALNVMLVYSLYWMTQREAAEAKREEGRMRELAGQLEKRVELRTQALKRSNEDLQQFAYIVSHDLQEPLRMVGNYTELLRRKYEGRLDADADSFIGYAVDGVKRMTALIKDLLEYSRVGESEDKELEAVNPEEVLETVLLNLSTRIGDAQAVITHGDLPVVATHRVWFTQLLQNLVGNALKYRSERPPRVHVSAIQGASRATFSISDNGIGIDPKYRDEVFGVFKRLHGRDVEGTGIGLAMCKKIVERAGGRIWFESEPGQGATFYFTIPYARQAAPAGSEPDPL